MKNMILLLLTIPFLAFTIQDDRSKLVGKWKGEDEKEVGYFIFDKEGYASIEVGGQTLGGKDFIIDGVKMSMTFEVRRVEGQMEVDLIAVSEREDLNRKVLCIAKFIDENTMEFAIDFTGIRPAGFDEENSIILTREP